METESDFSVKVKSMLRRAGLGEVPLPVIACLGALCVSLVVLALVHFWPGASSDADFQTTAGTRQQQTAIAGESGAAAELSAGSSTAVATDGGPIAVDVEGAVRSPGVYELPADARVADAVEAAGGLSRNAARTSVNLAQKLQDGTQVYVATKKEASAGAGTGAASGASQAGNTSGSQGSSGGAKVNINTASAEELQTLSGIGPSLSQRIVDYRESKGPFSSVEQLKEVSGIGDVRFESIKDSVCV